MSNTTDTLEAALADLEYARALCQDEYRDIGVTLGAYTQFEKAKERVVARAREEGAREAFVTSADYLQAKADSCRSYQRAVTQGNEHDWCENFGCGSVRAWAAELRAKVAP